MQKLNLRSRLQLAAVAAALAALALAPSSARAVNVGYYDMCYQQGRPTQATAITSAGHTAINLTGLTPADLAPVDVIFVDNCDNSQYDQAYVDHVSDVADAVAAGKILVLHDRYVDLAETILPGGSSFDIERYPTFPDPNNEGKNIDVLDATTLITNGPAGTIDNSTLDNGNFSNHGFAIAGSLPGSAKLILSTNDPTHIVTFVYTYGAGAVMYSSIPLDYYLDGGTPNPNFKAIYALNVVDYAAYLVTAACGNGVVDPGEDCDLAGMNGAPGVCCTASCSFESAATICRGSVSACDHAETCTGASAFCPADGPEPSGTVCRAAASECDAAETCDGSSFACPADVQQPAGTVCTDDGDLCTNDRCNGSGACVHPSKPDSDLDGTCDEQDACTNVGGGQNFATSKPKPNVTFARINNDTTPGNDGLKIAGEFQLAVGESFANVTPNLTGVRVVVENASGTVRVDQALPAGAYTGKGSRGWKINGKGSVWTYTDSTGGGLSGIKRMKILDRSKSAPRRVRVGITGTKSTYSVVAADAPIHAVVVLGNQASAAAGVCGETSFGPSSCRLNGKGTTLICR